MRKIKRQDAEPRKILFIHHGRGIGGACLSLLYLVQSLDKQNCIPTVLFMQDSAAVKLFLDAGIAVVGPLNKSDFSHTKIWWYRWYHPHHLFKAVFNSLQLFFGLAAKHLDILRPDIIHLNTSSLWVWACVARRHKIPVLWHIREPLSDGYFGIRKKFTQWAVGRWSSKILPICYDNALPWKKNPKTELLYNAVPEENFKVNLMLKINQTPTMLFLGGLSIEKGTLWLLQSFEKILQKIPEAKLLIAGTWQPKLGVWNNYCPITPWQRYCRKVLKLVQKLGDSVQILGVVQQVPNLLQKVDLLVFPATVGHFARPVIEAGFMAKPVVASNLSPMPELVKNNITGILVSPNDINALAEAVIKLLQNSNLAQKLGANAYNFCQQKFGLKNQQKRFATILKNTLQ